MNNLASLTAQPRPLKIGDIEYMAHPLTMDDLGALQAWIDRQRPDPFDVVNAAIAKGNYSMAQQQFLLKAALEESRKPRMLIGSSEADELIGSVEGIKHVLYLSIKKSRPDFTEADADILFSSLTSVDIAKTYNVTGLDLVVNDPKSPPLNVVPPSNPSGPAGNRRSRRAAASQTGGKSTIR